jgi:hypothetical protein
MDAKQEQEIIDGLLPFTIHGVTRLVPELRWRENREWQRDLEDRIARLVLVPQDTPDGVRAISDAEREAVLAYDRTGVLGNLEDASEREIDAIYERLLEVAYPKASSQTLLAVAMVRQALTSVQASLPSGPSPSGISPTSTRSRSGKSSSSGRRRKSA